MANGQQVRSIRLFQGLVVLIAIIILLSVFVGRSKDFSIQTENAAVKSMQTQMDSALAILVYRYAIEQKLAQIPRLEKANPFTLIEKTPELDQLYGGVIDDNQKVIEGKWFFNEMEKAVVFRSRRGRPVRTFQIKFYFRDRNDNRRFDPDSDEIQSLRLVEI